MKPEIILALLQMILNEVNLLAQGTGGAKYTAIGLAIEDTILKVQAQLAADANSPIDLDTL